MALLFAGMLLVSVFCCMAHPYIKILIRTLSQNTDSALRYFHVMKKCEQAASCMQSTGCVMVGYLILSVWLCSWRMKLSPTSVLSLAEPCEKQSVQSDLRCFKLCLSASVQEKSVTEKPWHHGWTEMSHRRGKRGGGHSRPQRQARYLVNWNVKELQRTAPSFFSLFSPKHMAKTRALQPTTYKNPLYILIIFLLLMVTRASPYFYSVVIWMAKHTNALHFKVALWVGSKKKKRRS